MNHRLIYVMGPSGAGKDSVLDWLRHALPVIRPITWARRTITRPVQSGGEAHEALDKPAFDQLHAAGHFAMAWQANGLDYGVRREQLAALSAGQWVLVNGSRGYLNVALQRHCGMTVVHITAPPGVLEQRLLSRGRETPAQIQARVARAVAFTAPPGTIEIHNVTTVERAGTNLLQALRLLDGWPHG